MDLNVGKRFKKHSAMIGDVRIDSITTAKTEEGFKIFGLGDNDVIYWLDDQTDEPVWRVHADPHPDED